PLRSLLQRWQSYAVISLETPKPDALRKKSENQRREFGLKRVANGYPRRRTRLIDKFANATRNQIGFRRILHVAFRFLPSFGDFCFISLVRQLALDQCIVEVGADIAGLAIDYADSRICQL